ncbi:MAG: serine/threonine protein kinase [Spirochaetales bacterium]|nr:serine/threonine protein kinase [Spirochaetales bacterium]
MAANPEKIDKYGEVSLIARGGMGAVYKALHPTLNRQVILKKLTLRGKASFSERFKREARILMDFKHDDIVTVFDHFKQGSSFFIVMEYVDGISLEQLIKDQRYLDSLITAYILLHAAKALEYAHERGVIHRDIKPANILLSKDGNIKLADFGIASSSDDTDSGLTSEGMTLGTPSYMAPEQFQNSRNVDAKADIYALGVMAYEMLTGKQPFTGGFCPELIHAKQKGKYKNPKKYVPDIQRSLLRILRKCMRASIKHRMQSSKALIRKLEHLLKPFDQESLKALLSSLVEEKEPLPRIRRKRNVFKAFTVALGAAAGAALLVFALITSTMLHPLFQGNTHGRFRLEVRVPPLKAETSGGAPEAVLFIDDAADIPEVDTLTLFPELFSRDTENKTYTSLPLFLPSGQYRIKIILSGDVYWSSFFLPAYDSQRKDVLLKQHVERIVFPEVEAGRVKVEVHVYDAVNGKTLEKEADIFINADNRFVPFDSTMEVLSGTVRSFLVRASGYLDQEYALFLRPENRQLRLSAALAPLPAEITLRGNTENLNVSINGSHLIDSYEKNPDSADSGYSIVSSDLREMDLTNFTIVPGRYRLEGKRNGISGTIDFSIAAGEKIELTVSEGNASPLFVRK